ncbi:hypothetical protein [Pseudomonas brassicacearum]|uniref:hypothetical protein n=1 Tax=Pseudomonas brassicacearum TaxID=930166 RepID=UPI00161F7A64|nr:hypothetical protein [Pseudomonas brassicacearum]
MLTENLAQDIAATGIGCLGFWIWFVIAHVLHEAGSVSISQLDAAEGVAFDCHLESFLAVVSTALEGSLLTIHPPNAVLLRCTALYSALCGGTTHLNTLANYVNSLRVTNVSATRAETTLEPAVLSVTYSVGKVFGS